MSKDRRDFILFLEDIVMAITNIEKYTQGLSFEELKKNQMAVDAVVRNFEIIGEAVKSLPRKLKGQYPDIEWNEAAGFRDVLIHDYFGIDLEIVWDTLRMNLPNFKDKILKVLANENSQK